MQTSKKSFKIFIGNRIALWTTSHCSTWTVLSEFLFSVLVQGKVSPIPMKQHWGCAQCGFANVGWHFCKSLLSHSHNPKQVEWTHLQQYVWSHLDSYGFVRGGIKPMQLLQLYIAAMNPHPPYRQAFTECTESGRWNNIFTGVLLAALAEWPIQSTLTT